MRHSKLKEIKNLEVFIPLVLTFYTTFLASLDRFQSASLIIFFLSAAFIFYGAYLLRPLKQVYTDKRQLVLLLTFLTLLGIAKLGETYNWFYIKIDTQVYYLLLIGSFYGILIKTFLRKTDIYPLIILSTLSLGLVSLNIFTTLGFLFSNLVTADIYEKRRKVISAVVAIIIANIIFASLLVANQLLNNVFGVTFYLLFLPISIIVQIFLLFGIQKLLDLIPFMYSDEKLKSLASLEHPLIEELLLRAPGTYHHSVMVSLLSEALAKKLGLNPLTVKVGAMFHDIGKIINPQYFIENRNGENPHDKLSPEASAAIIKGHVTEGIKLARKYNIPEEIIAFIPEHQGTKLIKYFYHKAREKNPNVAIEKFKYTGPIPQSKETAIVMIADTVEAMVRALKNPTVEDIKAVIDKAINNLQMEGQLASSHLTPEEIETIKETLLELLTSYYHKRIQYPEGKQTAKGR
jgi:putative nucleotidyltransferase with HDIG domain